MRVGCLESAGTLKGGIGKSSSSWTVSTSEHGSQTCPMMIDDLAPGREVTVSRRCGTPQVYEGEASLVATGPRGIVLHEAGSRRL